MVDRLAGTGRAHGGHDLSPGGRRGELLAVFGHEEAGMFLWSLGSSKAADGWRVAETRSGELASVLCGPCRRANGVALDPLPEMHQDGTAALVRVGRERFLARLLERGRPGPAGHTRKVA